MAEVTDTRTGSPTAGSGFGPKLRSRKDGAAIPLDDLDKRLLNLMQGSFPIAPRPYQHVAAQAGITEDEVMTRVQRLLDERIIRQVTPIFDTRALGYSSMLVAAKVDPENPWRAANIINAHPGVSHNYLRNHEFNIWFTIATEPDSPLGLEQTLRSLAASSPAPSRSASCRRSSCSRSAWISRWRPAPRRCRQGRRGGRAGRDRTPALRRLRPRRDPRHSGRPAGDLRALRPRRGGAGIPQEQLLAHLEGMVERRLLRRVAAILFHRRAGFSANGMGVWKVPDERILELGMRMAPFRGISHCYQRPTYADWPYSVFTMAHGRSKEECDAILDSIAEHTGISERATLYSSTEFKKIRLLYFTDDYRDWERGTPAC